MGGQDKRCSCIPDLFGQHVHDNRTGRGVEVPGRLVGQDELRVGDQGPRDGYSLHLAPGELSREAVFPAAEAGSLQEPRSGSSRSAFPVKEQRQLDVLDRGQRREQLEELEHEADVASS